jgi:hypothetical protein
MVEPGVEQSNQFARFPIDGSDVSSLMFVAQRTTKSQVRQVSLPAMFGRDDVIELMPYQ